jgi:hypothetical protein
VVIFWFLFGWLFGRTASGARRKRPDKDGMETLKRPEEWG